MLLASTMTLTYGLKIPLIAWKFQACAIEKHLTENVVAFLYLFCSGSYYSSKHMSHIISHTIEKMQSPLCLQRIPDSVYS